MCIRDRFRAREETRFLQTNGEAFDPFSGDEEDEAEVPLKFLTAQGLTLSLIHI